MIEIKNDIWTLFQLDNKPNKWISITTNGYIKKWTEEAVMGRGIAKQAAEKYPKLPSQLGRLLKGGNSLYIFPEYNLITFPTKVTWSEPANLDLIEKSCKSLSAFFLMDRYLGANVYIVRPGCGNGQLGWDTVKPIMLKYFKDNDNLIVVDWKE
jgi:hypothetical protein